jgi:hypothetical protein
VDDHVIGIDQHPVGGRKTFDPDVLPELPLDSFGEFRCHCSNLPRRPARRDDHVVGDARFAFERNGADFESLVVVERLQDQLVKLFDIDRSAAGDCLP